MRRLHVTAVAVVLGVGVGVGAISGVVGGQPARPSRPAAAAPAAQPIVGFADLHTHHMGHLMFDGEWLVGEPSGPSATALAPCTQNGLHGLAAAMGRKGHTQTSQGHPSFRDWPSWDNVQHQSIHEAWLHKAHQDGLKLLVVSFSNFEPFCRALKLIKLRKDMVNDCRDMRVVKRQYDEVIKFAAEHPWYVIVKTPAEARAAIARGNLAVVLAIEVSNLFDEDHFGAGRSSSRTGTGRACARSSSHTRSTTASAGRPARIRPSRRSI